MASFPRYEDSLSHDQFGKSRLPIFIVEKQMMRNYRLHYHNFAELSLVVEGTGTEIINGKPFRFSRGTVSLLLPHHIHEIHLDRAPVHKYNCMFDIQLLFSSPSDRKFANFLLQTGQKLPSQYKLDEEQTVLLQTWFEAMKLEYESEFFAKETSLRSKLMEGLVFITRTLHTGVEQESPAVQTQSNFMLLLQYVHIHYNEELSLTSIAEHFSWNASYVSRLFKQHLGQTFIQHLHELRVDRAASLLVTTKMDIVDIAVEVGFDHVKTMRRAFKKLKNATPKLYRDSYRSAEQTKRLEG
ncbi:AraC family transcriptional regulator [Paenibacillus ginsengarvi]|uniref:AraC family transcriptional regulator n=1 Tax=Paenibacillus ginsengarvi TaxID=400777 RepID=A0A3B0BED2_9BACL|nr:AraC family transcriptional regulator [Paenibacillus ginsengarvi]RKN70684.1 AraC family transcriptional regulator [Paenibacillus ginsengarvi]